MVSNSRINRDVDAPLLLIGTAFSFIRTAAWASEYSLVSNKARGMDIVTNSFCAGGVVLGDGTWINGSFHEEEGPPRAPPLTFSFFSLSSPSRVLMCAVGGNQGVTWGGLTAPSQTGGAPYDDLGEFTFLSFFFSLSSGLV